MYNVCIDCSDNLIGRRHKMNENLDNKKILIQAIARLESQVDFLQTEFTHLNELLFNIGFPEGLISLKETAEELLSEKKYDCRRHRSKNL